MSAHPHTRRAAALTGAVALAGAVAFGAPASAQAAPTQAKPAPKACVAATCRVVAKVDVDGDGRADTVSMTPTRSRGSLAWTLRAVTARKAVSQVTYATPWLYADTPSWFGAARIDGVPGHELVVRTGFGAHTQFFSVFSWRGGRLVAQRDPQTRSTEWVTDGALSVSMGYTGGVSRGARTLTKRVYLRNPDTGRYDGEAWNYTWRAGAWRQTGHSRVRVNPASPKLRAAYGWHVAGLPLN